MTTPRGPVLVLFGDDTDSGVNVNTPTNENVIRGFNTLPTQNRVPQRPTQLQFSLRTKTSKKATKFDGSLSDSECYRKEKRQDASTDDHNNHAKIHVQQHKSLRSRLFKKKPSQKIDKTATSTIDQSSHIRRISCQDLGGGECEGWMWKKKERVGLRLKHWTKAWFVLANRNLYYYENKENEKADGVIYLPGFKVSPASEVKSKKFAFKAHHAGTTFYFAVERQDDMSKWMNKLGLASLENFDINDLPTSPGYLTPTATPADCSRGFYSDSDDESMYSCGGSVPGSPTSSHSRASTSTESSREDITDLYRRLCQADLDLEGSNMKNKRATILQVTKEGDNDEQTKYLKLMSLMRTLKDREQQLTTIDDLLMREVITSKQLSAFMQENSNILHEMLPEGQL